MARSLNVAALLLLLLVAAPADAQTAGRKFLRGLAGMTTAFLEVPGNMVAETRTRGAAEGIPFGFDGPQLGTHGRMNPIHLMSAVEGRVGEGDFRYSDDIVVMPLQCATQWDSLAHVYYDGQLYNGFPATTITAAGAARNAIDRLGPGIVSRGVLLDVARLWGVDRVAPGVAIKPADLDAAERAERVRLGTGDVLLVRTGHLGVFTVDRDREGYMRRTPGLGVACVEWLHAR